MKVFLDTITLNGQVVFESISHYYPNVLTAMRTRDIAVQICVTNRIEVESYNELRIFGRKAIQALEIGTAATHMEWFFGGEGLKFSEIACRPPGVSTWDLFSHINDIDLYQMWANAICHGKTVQKPSRRSAGGMISLRPNRDGRMLGIRESTRSSTNMDPTSLRHTYRHPVQKHNPSKLDIAPMLGFLLKIRIMINSDE